MANEELRIHNLNRALHTAYELFLCHGIENTTQSMLARSSGLSRASIDRYFANKADCVLQTALRAAHLISDKMSFLDDVVASKKYTGLEILKQYMQTMKRIYCENPRQFVLIAEIRIYIFRNYPDPTAVFKQLSAIQGDRKLLKNIFLLGIEDGSMVSDIVPEDETIYLGEFYRELLVNLSFASNPSSIEKQEFIDKYISRIQKTYEKKR